MFSDQRQMDEFGQPLKRAVVVPFTSPARTPKSAFNEDILLKRPREDIDLADSPFDYQSITDSVKRARTTLSPNKSDPKTSNQTNKQSINPSKVTEEPRIISSPSQSNNASIHQSNNSPIDDSINHDSTMSDLLSIREAELNKQSIELSRKDAQLKLEQMRLTKWEQQLTNQSNDLQNQTAELSNDREQFRREYRTKMKELSAKRNEIMQSIQEAFSQSFKQSIDSLVQQAQSIVESLNQSIDVNIDEPSSLTNFPSQPDFSHTNDQSINPPPYPTMNGTSPQTQHSQLHESTNQRNDTSHIQSNNQTYDQPPPLEPTPQSDNQSSIPPYVSHTVLQDKLHSPAELQAIDEAIKQSNIQPSLTRRSLEHCESDQTNHCQPKIISINLPPTRSNREINLRPITQVRASHQPTIQHSQIEIGNKGKVFQWFAQIPASDEKAVPYIIRAIVEHKRSVQVAQAACKVFERMIKQTDGIGWQKWVNQGGLLCLLKSMRAHASDHQFVIAAYNIIQSIPIQRHDERVVKPGLASDVLVEVYRTNKSTNDAVNGSLHLILILINQSTGAEMISLKGDPRFLEIAMAGLRRYQTKDVTRPSLVRVINHAASTLYELLSNESTQFEFIETQGGVLHTVNAMLQYPREEELQLYGCRILGVMSRGARHRLNQGLFTSTSTLNAVVAALDTHSKSAEVVDAVLSLLAFITYPPDAKQHLNRSTIVQLILESIERYIDSTRVVLNGLSALGQLGDDNHTCAEQISRCHGADVINKILDRHARQHVEGLQELANNVMQLELNGRSINNYPVTHSRKVVRLNRT